MVCGCVYAAAIPRPLRPHSVASGESFGSREASHSEPSAPERCDRITHEEACRKNPVCDWCHGDLYCANSNCYDKRTQNCCVRGGHGTICNMSQANHTGKCCDSSSWMPPECCDIPDGVCCQSPYQGACCHPGSQCVLNMHDDTYCVTCQHADDIVCSDVEYPGCCPKGSTCCTAPNYHDAACCTSEETCCPVGEAIGTCCPKGTVCDVFNLTNPCQPAEYTP